MKKEVLGTCPVCGNNLEVIELKCPCCETHIQGKFELSKFDYLNKVQKEFVFIFLQTAGNIKAIEKELNISYPTVKKYIQDIQQALGLVGTTDIIEERLTKEKILEKLKNGEFDFEEASELIKEIEK